MPISLQEIFDNLKSQYGDYNQKLPPVEKWQPDHCGDIGLLIKKDGTWWQNGIKFSRQNLVKLFSTILRKDADGKTYLVTPHEKVVVEVEDAHFIIVRADLIEGEVKKIIFTTNLGETFEVDENHKIWVEQKQNQPRPYVIVRGNLYALINRASYYDLVNWGCEIGGKFGIMSNKTFFELGDVE